MCYMNLGDIKFQYFSSFFLWNQELPRKDMLQNKKTETLEILLRRSEQSF